MSNSIHLGPFQPVSVQFGPFRAASGESWGVGWGGVGESGFSKGKEYHYLSGLVLWKRKALTGTERGSHSTDSLKMHCFQESLNPGGRGRLLYHPGRNDYKIRSPQNDKFCNFFAIFF